MSLSVGSTFRTFQKKGFNQESINVKSYSLRQTLSCAFTFLLHLKKLKTECSKLQRSHQRRRHFLQSHSSSRRGKPTPYHPPFYSHYKSLSKDYNPSSFGFFSPALSPQEVLLPPFNSTNPDSLG